MSNLLHPYRVCKQGDAYYFDTPSGAQYFAYFLEYPDETPNLFTFNFDKITDGVPRVVDYQVFDTICSILEDFFNNHKLSMLLVCDSTDGREAGRKRLFNSWYNRIAPEGLVKIDREGHADEYELFVSILVWNDNPNMDELISWLDRYCEEMTDTDVD